MIKTLLYQVQKLSLIYQRPENISKNLIQNSKLNNNPLNIQINLQEYLPMEQSDAMLISSLKQYIKLSDDIVTIRDIRTQNIHTLACSVFQALRIDYTELKQIAKAQRFRSMTKLTQIINQEMDTNFDLNDIMNPSLAFLRKLLLAFVGKLGSAEGQRNKALIGQKSQNNQKRYQKQILKNWINQQFIYPQLRINKKIRFQSHLLKIDLKKDLFKRNIVSQVSSVPGNSNAVIRAAMAKQTIERKKRQQQEGLTKKGQEQNDRNVIKIVRNNTEDWQKAQATMKKLKRQLLKVQQPVVTGPENQNAQMSVFQQQVEQIAQQQKKLKGDDKKTQAKSSQILSLQQDMNPMQKIKRQAQNIKIALQNQLSQILAAISEAKQSIQQREALKKKLQDQIVLYQERAAAQRESRAALKKQVQKQKIILDSLQGETDIVKQVQQLEQQVKYLQTQAQKQINNLQTQIVSTKKQGQQKLQILRDLKLRLNKIQTDYAKICQQIDDKNEIKGKVKITKAGLTRQYYSKKISQMEARWKETQKQSKKIIQNVGKIREEIRRSLYLAQITQTEVQNLTNSSKLRTQAQNTTFKQIFQQCQKSFKQTMKCIEQINETKNQIQEYEMKVHALAGKDYKENIKKLENALEELQKQLRDATSKR